MFLVKFEHANNTTYRNVNHTNILIKTGEEYVIDSDGFFQLESQPKRVAVIGAGYIAVELAGVFNGLGSDTSLFVRGATALRNFDSMISGFLDSSMKKSGMQLNDPSQNTIS